MNDSASYSADTPYARTDDAASGWASPMVWLLIGYMWLFIHRPFEIWPWLAPFHIERVYMIVAIVFWLLSGPRMPVPNRLHLRFALFVAAMLVSWLLSPFQDAGTTTIENYLKYAVFYVLLVTSVRSERDLRAIIAGYVVVMTILMLHSLREYYCGRAWYAQGIVRLAPVGMTFDFNDFAGLIVCSLPFGWVLWHEWPSWTTRALLVGYLGLSGYCIIATGSRMGFLSFGLACMLLCLASPQRWRLMAVCPALLAVAWLLLPADRKDRYLTLVDPSRGPKSATGSAGNFRYAGFESSLELFEERPLLGFGPMGYRVASGTGMMPHNLYGQVLAELGAAGAIAFALILWGVVQNTVKARRIARDAIDRSATLPWRIAMAASAAFLLLAIMSWGFNFLFWFVWLWFGGFQIVAMECLSRQSEYADMNEAIAERLQDVSFSAADAAAVEAP
jgi:hypothetical protein